MSSIVDHSQADVGQDEMPVSPSASDNAMQPSQGSPQAPSASVSSVVLQHIQEDEQGSPQAPSAPMPSTVDHSQADAGQDEMPVSPSASDNAMQPSQADVQGSPQAPTAVDPISSSRAASGSPASLAQPLRASSHSQAYQTPRCLQFSAAGKACIAVSALPYAGFSLGCLAVDTVAPPACSLGTSVLNRARRLAGYDAVPAAAYEPIVAFPCSGAQDFDLHLPDGWAGNALRACGMATMTPMLATTACLGLSNLALWGLRSAGQRVAGLAL